MSLKKKKVVKVINSLFSFIFRAWTIFLHFYFHSMTNNCLCVFHSEWNENNRNNYKILIYFTVVFYVENSTNKTERGKVKNYLCISLYFFGTFWTRSHPAYTFALVKFICLWTSESWKLKLTLFTFVDTDEMEMRTNKNKIIR